MKNFSARAINQSAVLGLPSVLRLWAQEQVVNTHVLTWEEHYRLTMAQLPSHLLMFVLCSFVSFSKQLHVFWSHGITHDLKPRLAIWICHSPKKYRTLKMLMFHFCILYFCATFHTFFVCV